jgi:hypothetical protein
MSQKWYNEAGLGCERNGSDIDFNMGKEGRKVVVSENPKEELYIREGCVRNWSPTKMNVDWQKNFYGNLVRNVGKDGSWFLVVPPYKNLEVACNLAPVRRVKDDGGWRRSVKMWS